MSEERLPLRECPFCGGEADIACGSVMSPYRWVECEDCGAEGPTLVSNESAALAWNRRADRWIPVSERKPEKEGHYFVTAQLWNGNTETQITYWTGPEREPSNQFNLHCRAVTAWQPLPEPYKEGK